MKGIKLKETIILTGYIIIKEFIKIKEKRLFFKLILYKNNFL